MRLPVPAYVAETSLLALLLALLTQGAHAQPLPGREPAPDIIELGRLQGAAEPVPSLKYIFSNFGMEAISENAAVHYLRALRRFQSVQRGQPTWETDWLSLKPSELADVPIESLLDDHQRVFESLERASRCNHCEWHLFPSDSPSLKRMLELNLDDIQALRSLARLLQIQLRYQIHTQNWQQASETARVLFRLGYDLQEIPILVAGLVGAACQGIAYGELEHWISAAESPNLYWALQSLPHPRTDLSHGMGGELGLILRGIRALDQPEEKNWPAEKWIQSLSEDFSVVAPLAGSDTGAGTYSQLAVSAMIVRGYPIAKQSLLDQGYPLEKLETMPTAQVVCIHQAGLARRYLHDILKWRMLDTPESRRRMEAQEEASRQLLDPTNPDGFTLMMIPVILTAFRMVAHAETRLRRTHEALSTLEAIRMHVAATGGPPESLKDITVVPVPKDSLNGTIFEYRMDKDKATLVIQDFLVTGKKRIYQWNLSDPQ